MVRLVKGNVDFESLSEVLKNQIRRRIITCLSDKESISYVDLMDCVGIGNTGKFNYHLKILGDLLEKNENGKYRLSEKGQLAVQFLQKFDAKSEETVFRTRSFSLFSGFIWLVLVYPFLVLMFGWYLYFADPTLVSNASLVPLIGLSLVFIPAFVLLGVNQFPVLEIDRDSIVVRWATGRRYFILEEAKIDVRGHILRLGGRMPFGWIIPFREDAFSLLHKQVENYRSRPLYLAFALPPTILTLMFAFARRLEGFMPAELWAVFWGVTTTISLAMLLYSFPVEIHLGKFSRGFSATVYSVFVGVIIAISIFLTLAY